MPVINTKNCIIRIYNYIFVLRYIANRFYSQEMISERKSTNSLHFISYVVTTSNA